MPESFGDGLPEFDAARCYLLRGATLQLLKKTTRMHRPCATTGGGIDIASSGTEQGTFLRGVKAGQGGGTTTAGDELPDGDAGKYYLLRPETIAAFERALASNHAKVVTNSGLTSQDSPAGVTVGSAP